MSKQTYATPQAGLKVRNPETSTHLAEGGEWVTKSSYWLRHAADKSVVLSDKAPKKKGS